MAQIIKRGVLQSFDPTTYTASVLLIEATSAFLAGVPIATSVNALTALPNAFCAVLFFNEHDHSDAVIVAVYPNGSVGVPAPPVTPPPPPPPLGTSVLFANAATVLNGALYSAAFALQLGGLYGVPSGAAGVYLTVAITTNTANAYVTIAPYGSSQYQLAVGEQETTVPVTWGDGVVALGSNFVTITPSAANTHIYLWVNGYIR